MRYEPVCQLVDLARLHRRHWCISDLFDNQMCSNCGNEKEVKKCLQKQADKRIILDKEMQRAFPKQKDWSQK